MSCAYTAPIVHADIKAFAATWPPKPETRAGQYLCRWLPNRPGHADLIATRADLGSEGSST
jgi:hypothetical protein